MGHCTPRLSKSPWKGPPGEAGRSLQASHVTFPRVYLEAQRILRVPYRLGDSAQVCLQTPKGPSRQLIHWNPRQGPQMRIPTLCFSPSMNGPFPKPLFQGEEAT